MSNIDPSLAVDFFEATRVYDDLRHERLVRSLGEVTLLQAADEVPTYEAIVRLSEEELARLHEEQNAGTDVAAAKLAFDQEAGKVYGDVDGFRPSYIEAGLLNLWKDIGGGKTLNLDAATAAHNELVCTKSTSRIGEHGIERNVLSTTEADMATLKKAVEQLQFTNSYLAAD